MSTTEPTGREIFQLGKEGMDNMDQSTQLRVLLTSNQLHIIHNTTIYPNNQKSIQKLQQLWFFGTGAQCTCICPQCMPGTLSMHGRHWPHEIGSALKKSSCFFLELNLTDGTGAHHACPELLACTMRSRSSSHTLWAKAHMLVTSAGTWYPTG